jgi:hypothetical protein
MKKLLTLLLSLAALAVSAQETTLKNQRAEKFIFDLPDPLCLPPTPIQRTSISLIVGPNWFMQYTPILKNNNLEPRTGYSLGIDLARRLAGEHWQIKLGMRYNVWKYVYKSGSLTWPSEYATGVYVFDPSLPHQIEQRITNKAWQYFAGVRWLPGRPKQWRCYADAEIGATDIATTGDDLIRLTAGLGAGLQWKPGRHFSLFAQPGARYIFHPHEANIKFLPLQAEMGMRWEM